MAPMHNVPLDDNCADFITAFDSLEHLLPEDVDLTFKEMHRIAKSNAEFCFSICYRPSFYLVKGQNLHPTVESEAWWKEKISAVGFPENKKQYIIGRFK
jgi:ubiquinone/menaquinone biosynthesis C-methylase UbiE